MMHSFLYLWLIPFVIYPRFGHNGILMSVIVAVLISVAVMASLLLREKNHVKDGAKNSPPIKN
ncbi:hypothetical protein [Desulfamplus magnetovallimortis]|uniref:hypothetical protein n=1 Tax=Desulfamplus magnetovallimortis TaxID=1246637 RepID=UPI0009B967CC|nr:hypothetical protein [Desulfamplus magnetovallimortis]